MFGKVMQMTNSQRVVFIEESHTCPACEKLVCRVTLGNGNLEKHGCQCENTELLFLDIWDELKASRPLGRESERPASRMTS